MLIKTARIKNQLLILSSSLFWWCWVWTQDSGWQSTTWTTLASLINDSKHQLWSSGKKLRIHYHFQCHVVNKILGVNLNKKLYDLYIENNKCLWKKWKMTKKEDFYVHVFKEWILLNSYISKAAYRSI
jgi:hypothetical protein